MVQPRNDKQTIFNMLKGLKVCLPDSGPAFDALTNFKRAWSDALESYFTGAGWIERTMEDERGVIREFLQYVPRRDVELVDY